MLYSKLCPKQYISAVSGGTTQNFNPWIYLSSWKKEQQEKADNR